MSDIRKSFSKLKKDFKQRIGGKKRATDTAGVNAAEETASSSPPLPPPDSRVAASGRDEEGGRINTDVSQAHSRDQSPQPKPMQADEGDDNPQEKEADVDEKEATWSCRLRLGPNVGGAVGSSTSQEIEQAPSPPSITPITTKQEPGSTWTLFPSSCV